MVIETLRLEANHVFTLKRYLLGGGVGVVKLWQFSIRQKTSKEQKNNIFYFEIVSTLSKIKNLSPGGGPSLGGPQWDANLISFWIISPVGKLFWI